MWGPLAFIVIVAVVWWGVVRDLDRIHAEDERRVRRRRGKL